MTDEIAHLLSAAKDAIATLAVAARREAAQPETIGTACQLLNLIRAVEREADRVADERFKMDLARKCGSVRIRDNDIFAAWEYRPGREVPDWVVGDKTILPDGTMHCVITQNCPCGQCDPVATREIVSDHEPGTWFIRITADPLHVVTWEPEESGRDIFDAFDQVPSPMGEPAEAIGL